MDKKNLGALWKNEKGFLSGVLELSELKKAAKGNTDGKIRIIIFKNDFKKKETHPDFNILISKTKEAAKKEDSFF